MFLRTKKTAGHTYIQLVENQWVDGKSKQRIIISLGRLDVLKESGQLGRLARTAALLAEDLLILGHEDGEALDVRSKRIGPVLVFERLWRESGIRDILEDVAKQRRFDFPIERAIFSAVLHRLVDPGSDRATDKWKRDYAIDAADQLDLHHYYRTMAWLGEPLNTAQCDDEPDLGPRCMKDRLEELLFERRRNLFSSLSLVFFDTTSIYFEGAGGQKLGQRGHSKDHRADLNQVVVGLVLDERGQPICSEYWPGNTTDVKTLVPIVDRLQRRFQIGNVCIVADRGMISNRTMEEIEGRGWHYILGARLRSNKVVRDIILSRAGRYKEIYPERLRSNDPSPLQVKEVFHAGKRYVVCLNEEQRRKDVHDRAMILTALEEAIKNSDKNFVGNKGYRKYLKIRTDHFGIDYDKVAAEGRFDGKWVLTSNAPLKATTLALKYKQLWMVEDLFRQAKSIMSVRPIYHKRDETIRGHLFCSYLALILRKELLDRIGAAGLALEWKDIIRDLDQLTETRVGRNGLEYIMRNATTGCTGQVFRAIDTTLPPTLRKDIPTAS